MDCSIEGCSKQVGREGHLGLALCGMHYLRFLRHGDPGQAAPMRAANAATHVCKVDGCVRLVGRTGGQGMCQMHNFRYKRHGDVGPVGLLRDPNRGCKIEGCERRHSGHGFCGLHLRRFRKHGDPHVRLKKQRLPVGTRYRTAAGYVFVYLPDHPNADHRGKVREHMVVMSEHVARPLHADETVHHRNGVKDDNRLENLELWTSRHPKGQRIEDLVAFAKEVLAEYGDLV